MIIGCVLESLAALLCAGQLTARNLHQALKHEKGSGNLCGTGLAVSRSCPSPAAAVISARNIEGVNKQMKLQAIFPALFWLSILYVNACATAIMVIRTADRVIIAADSKAVDVGSNKEAYSVEKIHSVGSYYYAASGILVTSDGFSIHSIIRAAFEGSGTLTQKKERFTAAIFKPLVEVITRVRAASPAEQSRLIGSDGTILSVVFVGFERDIPTVIMLSWALPPNDPNTVNLISSSCPHDCNSPHSLYMLGMYEEMNAYVKTLGKSFEKDYVKSARAAVQNGINLNPERAGGPIRVLELTQAGPKWH